MFAISLTINFFLAFAYFFFSKLIATFAGDVFTGTKTSSLEDLYLPLILGASMAFIAIISQRLLATTWTIYFLNIAVLAATGAICWLVHPNRNVPNLESSFLSLEIGIRAGVALGGFLLISLLFWAYQKFV